MPIPSRFVDCAIITESHGSVKIPPGKCGLFKDYISCGDGRREVCKRQVCCEEIFRNWWSLITYRSSCCTREGRCTNNSN